MTLIRRFQRGETVPIWCEIKTWAGVYVNPDQGVKVIVIDPKGAYQVGTLLLGGVAMALEDAGVPGKYIYYFTPDATDPLGWWRIRCKGQDGLAALAKYTIADGGFYLE